MNNIKQIRVFLAVIFFIATVAYLFVGPHVHPMAVVSLKMQIIPSAIATTIGATLIWLALTFLFGRVYCSTVCPVGTLLDIPFRLRMKLQRRFHLKRYSYKSSKKYAARLHVLLIYIICLAIGLVGVPALIEPWNIMKQIAYAVSPTATESAWITLGLGVATGIVAGLAVLTLLLICGFLWGRDFCNLVCPIGTCLGAVAPYSLWHIEIDPDKCINCFKCEEGCRSRCIKVVSRHVDDSRCVRCFDCLKACPNDAIHFQRNRNRPATPLFRRKARSN